MSRQSDSLVLAAELSTAIALLLKKLRTQSPTHKQLSLTEREVIKLLAEHHDLLPSELAARQQVSAQAMTQILHNLGTLGYITRQPSATDKRKVRITLSAAGQAILPTVRQEVNGWMHRALLASCSAAELDTLRQALPILTKMAGVA